MVADITTFLQGHVDALRPLDRSARITTWESRTHNTPATVDAATRATTALREFHSDRSTAAKVEGWLNDGSELPPVIRRQLEFLRRSHLENALSPAEVQDLVEREQAIQTEFVTWRGRVAGEPVSNNRIREILGHSRDERERLEAWEASKSIGPRVAGPLRDLVRTRNASARRLGFRDHYALSLELQEIPQDTLLALAEDLRTRTEGPWQAMKARLDADIAGRLGIEASALRAHHYDDPFVQTLPRAGGVGDRLDALFADHDPVALSALYFRGIGLPVDAVLERSDLYEREGKDQHAFCIDIDRAGDVRILCNVRPDEQWTGTMLHELGHAVYDLGFGEDLPFLLRRPAHILTTEAVAQLFGRLTRNADWLGTMLDLPPSEVAALEEPLRLERSRAMLLFARWCLVMIHFERALYADPDRPDLNALWWSLVEDLQGVRPPLPVEGRDDWATKNHLAVAPVYYHNYILGEMLASQLDHRLRTLFGPGSASLAGDPRVGEFLTREIFAPGGRPHWNDLTHAATGVPLGTDAFLRDFAGEAG